MSTKSGEVQIVIFNEDDCQMLRSSVTNNLLLPEKRYAYATHVMLIWLNLGRKEGCHCGCNGEKEGMRLPRLARLGSQ